MTIINIGGETIILLDSLPSLVLSSEKLSISLGVLEMRKTRTEQNLSESNQNEHPLPIRTSIVAKLPADFVDLLLAMDFWFILSFV